MTDAMKVVVRIYKKDHQGRLYDDQEEWQLEDLGGTVPRVGEFLISPKVRGRDVEGVLAENKTVQIVEAVYYETHKRTIDHEIAWIVLVVTDRPMKQEEQALFI